MKKRRFALDGEKNINFVQQQVVSGRQKLFRRYQRNHKRCVLTDIPFEKSSLLCAMLSEAAVLLFIKKSAAFNTSCLQPSLLFNVCGSRIS